MEKKIKISKIIFILSFAPYILMLLFSLYFAVCGNEIYTFMREEHIRTDYGMPVFVSSMSMLAYLGTFVVPVLPVVIIYQVVFVVNAIRKRK